MLIERPPRFFRAFIRLLIPRALFRVKGCGKAVYLTFDDGPIPEVTPWVLDRLDEAGARATFFMVGDNASRNPGLVEEVRRRGHRVGNHTMHHLQGSLTATRRYLRDVALADKEVDSPLFRPPHGWLRPRQARALASKVEIVFYDLVTRDYSKRLTSGQVVQNVKRYARPGSIIVFHDSLKSWPRLQKALPEALKWLKEEGYTFGLLDEKMA